MTRDTWFGTFRWLGDRGGLFAMVINLDENYSQFILENYSQYKAACQGGFSVYPPSG